MSGFVHSAITKNMKIVPIINIFALILVSQIIDQTSAVTLAPKQSSNEWNADECLNNSVEHSCSGASNLVDNQSISPVDNASQLAARLKNTDKLTDAQVNFALNSLANPATLETSLRQVIFIHRHGDRTPITFPPKDDLKNEPFWAFHGYGQLTNRGKARLYLLGKMIRAHYNEFLHKSVNKNQRISRSSGSLRCIESAQTFLSGFLGLNITSSPDASELIWDENSNLLAKMWQPASIQSVPAKLDGMLAESAECEALTREWLDVIQPSEAVSEIFREYQPEKALLEAKMGYEMDKFYYWFWASSQIEVELSYFPDKVRRDIAAAFPRIEAAGNLALGAYQSTVKAKRLRSGLLINDLVSNMRNVRALHHQVESSSDKLKKFVHYAAHDLTVLTLIGMFGQWNNYPRRPDYASNIALELHQDSDDNWFVRVFYMAEVPSKPVELHFQECQSHCSLDKFAEMMQPFMVSDWQSWMKECGNDLSKLNPYEVGS